jgi:hypothetical protein
MDRRMKIGMGGLAVVAAAAVGGQLASSDDDDTPPRQLTALEAACQMIADGDTAVEAYDILLDLDVPAITASRAVNRAIAGEC